MLQHEFEEIGSKSLLLICLWIIIILLKRKSIKTLVIFSPLTLNERLKIFPRQGIKSIVSPHYCHG